MDIFLNKTEKDNLKKWKYSVEDLSITSEILDPFWNKVVTFVPNTVAPNVLTLAGFIFILYAHHLCLYYLNAQPTIISLITCLFTFIYMTLDAIDGKHARRTGNSSPLGELFDHACDNIGVVFLTHSICLILGLQNLETQWYIVQIAQLSFLGSHIDAFKNGIVQFGRFSGPGEFLMAYIRLIIIHITIDGSWLTNLFNSDYFGYLASAIYYGVYVFTIIKVAMLSNSYYSTRNGLLISLMARFIPSIMIYYGLSSSDMSGLSVISHGLVMAILTGDIIVSKMAKRDLHPLVPILVMISLFDNFFCVIASIVYYLTTLTEIAFYLRIPMFSVVRNVFCNGVFDMTHMGHMELFNFAANHGNRLIVGVHSDETVESYKRKPTMTHDERCATVRRCKFVDEVVENAPLVVTEEFIRNNNIHCVICSTEYDTPEDEYYAIPRKMGILVVKPRTDGISTTDLRNRLKNLILKSFTLLISFNVIISTLKCSFMRQKKNISINQKNTQLKESISILQI